MHAEADARPIAASNRHRDEVLLAIVVLLAIAGIAVTDFSPHLGLVYWVTVTPLFGAASIWRGWHAARTRGEPATGILVRQSLHWGALLVAIYLVHLLESSGRIESEEAGLIVLLTLALTTFLAGVHYEWRLCVLGALLAVTAAGAALVEEFFWVLLLPGLVAGAVVVFWKREASDRT